MIGRVGTSIKMGGIVFMKKRKTIMIITAFIVIILGLGSFMLVRGIGKTPVSDEQKYEPIKAPNAQTSVKIAATTGDKEKKSNKQMESTTPSSLSIPPVPIGDKSGLKTVTYAGDPSQQEKVDEDSDEYQEKRCMKLMHERGWYKPEDVTIIYGPSPKNDSPPGVWIWKEVHKGEYAGTEMPAHIKERIKEIDVKIQEAQVKGDEDEVSRLDKEFKELKRPYDNGVITRMDRCEIPKSWHQYFDDIFWSEANAIK